MKRRKFYLQVLRAIPDIPIQSRGLLGGRIGVRFRESLGSEAIPSPFFLTMECDNIATMDFQKFFKGKKVTQMGLGLLGRGVGDAEFLVRMGSDLIVTDLKNESELRPSLEKLKKFKNIKYVLGIHRLEDFRGVDFILKAAGVPIDSPYIIEARNSGVLIEMDASLFAKLAPKGVTVIGVTGTRGKSTTAHLIFHILKTAFSSKVKGLKLKVKSSPRVFLAGNVKDTATLPLLLKVKAGDFVVLELDSWQLQGFGDAKISPHIAVFTNFMDDHLNYYRGDREKYFSDKANIFKYQEKGDALVVGEQAALRVRRAKPPIVPTVARSSDVPSSWKPKIIGEHNSLNISCARAAARALGIDDVTIQKAVESFTGVEGRLQFLREVKGVQIYNDNSATTPDATLAGIRALGKALGGSTSKLPDLEVEPRSMGIVLIMGGADKGLDMSKLVQEIPKYCKALVLLPGSGTEMLQVTSYKLQIEVVEVLNLHNAVRRALDYATKGDTILFSPAFASFGMFQNEYDRGEQFTKIVESL